MSSKEQHHRNDSGSGSSSPEMLAVIAEAGGIDGVFGNGSQPADHIVVGPIDDVESVRDED
jgi:hypothetical protein